MTHDISVPINGYCPYQKKKYSPKITYSGDDSDTLNIPYEKNPLGLYCKYGEINGCNITPCPILPNAPDELTYVQIEELLHK